MLRLTLPTSNTPASVDAHPYRRDYEITPTSSEDSDSSFDGYENHPDEETGARAGALLAGLKGGGDSLGSLTRRAKTAPTTGGGTKAARRGAIAPNTKADAALTNAGKNASKGEVRAAKREAKRVAKEEAKRAKSKPDEPPPLQRQSNQEKLVQGANELRESLLQDRAVKKEKVQQRIDEGIDRADKTATQGGDSGAACLRHCGTSCGSVLWQSICACFAIAGAFWVGFIALSWFEIIGISSLPPGIEYGHKVGDIYRS
jgi:hypothetical protein